MHFRVALVAKCFCPRWRCVFECPVRDREVFEIGGQLENFLAHGLADFKGLGGRILSVDESRTVAFLALHLDLDESGVLL